MSQTLDIESQIYTAIYDSVLLADADWAALFQTGNIIRYDHLQGIEQGMKPNPNDADYPQAVLWLRSGMSDMWDGSPSFATFGDTPPTHWLENHDYVFRLELTSELQNVAEPDRLGSQSRAAFRKAGMKMGLPYVVGVRLTWESRRTEIEDEGKIRWKTTIDIFVKCQLDGATLQ